MAERRTQRNATPGRPRRPAVVTTLTASAVFAVLYATSPVPVEHLSLDPNHVGGLPWYVGIISTLGAVGWTVAAAAAAFAGWITSLVGRPRASSMLRGGALLSTVLLLDDLFQFHVLAKPAIGVPKVAMLGLYGLLAGWWLVTNRREIARTRAWLLVTATALLAASVLVDRLAGFALPDSGATIAVEDGFKFLGIVWWALYFAWTAGDIVRSVVSDNPTVGVGSAPGPEPVTSDQRADGQQYERQGQK